MDSDGSDQVQLTTDAVPKTRCLTGARTARRSPSAMPGDVGDIWIIDADGTDPIRRTTDAADDFAPSWSPDGSEIAFLSTRSGIRELFVMNADGSGQHSLLPGVLAFAPGWQPR